MRSLPLRLVRLRRVLLTAAAGVVLATPLRAQDPGGGPPAPRPDPLLSSFAGTWEIVDLPPGATYVTTCEMFTGGYQVVCRSVSRNNQGRHVEGMNVIAFSPADGEYQYVGMSSMGRLELLRGTFVDGRLVVTGTTGTGPNAVQTRVTLTPSQQRLDVVQEYSDADGPWTEGATVRYRRTR